MKVSCSFFLHQPSTIFVTSLSPSQHTATAMQSSRCTKRAPLLARLTLALALGATLASAYPLQALFDKRASGDGDGNGDGNGNEQV